MTHDNIVRITIDQGEIWTLTMPWSNCDETLEYLFKEHAKHVTLSETEKSIFKKLYKSAKRKRLFKNSERTFDYTDYGVEILE